MAVRTITVGGALGLALACTLPLDGKTACFTSDDCVDARVCVDEQCRDGACEVFCTAICEAADDCEGDPIADCDARCLAGDMATPPLLPALDPADCRNAYDAWAAGVACESLDCVLACSTLCEFATGSCVLVVDTAACFVGCMERNDACVVTMPTTCLDDALDDVLCWEDADNCQ